MTRLLFVGAAIVLLGTLSVPVLLSRRYSDSDRYKGEVADWHVRWGLAGSQEDRKGLIEELSGIEPPLGSTSALNRHRQYQRAHELAVLSDEAVDGLIEYVRASIGPDSLGRSGGSACEMLDESSAAPGAEGDSQRSSDTLMDSVRKACDVRSAAYAQLSVVRAEALLDWLKNEIRQREERQPAGAPAR